MFMWINQIMASCVERIAATSWLFKIGTRILPVPTAMVRGVAIKAMIPLNQYGVYSTFRTWESREPETLDWIDSFDSGATFFDIGANFGTETLYAALKINGPRQIVAFDLDLCSSFNLACNLQINNISCVEQYYLAVGNGSKFTRTSEHTNYSCVVGRPKYDRVGCNTCSLSLDAFVEMTQKRPDYVKIDVDGAELDVIRGMKAMLHSGKLKSVLIEVCSQVREPLLGLMREAGFHIELESSLGDTGTSNIVFNRMS